MYKFIKHFEGKVLDIIQKKTSGKKKKSKILEIKIDKIKDYIQQLDLEKNNGWEGWTEWLDKWEGWVEGFETEFSKYYKIGDDIKVNILIDKKPNSEVCYINFYSPDYVPDKFLTQLNAENINKMMENQNEALSLLKSIKIKINKKK